MGWLDGVMLVAFGAVAGFINVLAAGGSMLTLPLLMLLGLPPQVANGTNRVSIVLQSVSAVGSFRRAGADDLRISLHLSLPAVAGALLGAWLALLVSDAIFQGVLIAAMALASLMMLLPQPRLATQTLTPARITPTVHLAMFVIGVYGGFIQVGVGVLFIAVLYRLLRIDLAQVNVFKVFIIVTIQLMPPDPGRPVA